MSETPEIPKTTEPKETPKIMDIVSDFLHGKDDKAVVPAASGPESTSDPKMPPTTAASVSGPESMSPSGASTTGASTTGTALSTGGRSKRGGSNKKRSNKKRRSDKKKRADKKNKKSNKKR